MIVISYVRVSRKKLYTYRVKLYISTFYYYYYYYIYYNILILKYFLVSRVM